ncbi:MAG: DUF4445 domain-containing protein [Gemmatimonadales bacterium]|nr:DUF4445 domain-containing protein [Gemmatimonadales bacterium]
MALPLRTVDFQPLGRRVDTEPTATLLDAARAAGVALQATCGGAGTCGSCRVQRISGELTPATAVELMELDATERATGLRLACQACALSDTRVHLPADSLCTTQRLQLEAHGAVSVDPLEAGPGGLGLAVDLGTTKVAMYLVDLATGETIASRAAPNPQIAYGEDVISRVAYAAEQPDGAAQLTRQIRDALAVLAREVCDTAGVRRAAVREVVVVGNTAMHHLLADLPVRQLGLAPYRPAMTGPLDLAARDLGFDLEPGARVYLPPVVAGFVGSDHVAMLLGTGLDRRAGTVLAVDIGTNTEMTLLHGGRLRTCSSPSGPAFEGAHLSTGMRAAPGAVEAVRIRGNTVQVRTIDDAPPIGICGSGILDLMAELRQAGLLNERGTLQGSHPALRSGAKGPEIVLAGARESGTGRDLTVVRRDLHEIQMAKAAIRSGIDVLLDRAGLGPEALDEVLVAGAFGSYLDLRSALRIGMFPPVPRGRIRQLGNAAGHGARQLLVSPARRQRAEALAGRAEHVELSGEPSFRDRYLGALWIPHRHPGGVRGAVR